jgi:hypothetical protein
MLYGDEYPVTLLAMKMSVLRNSVGEYWNEIELRLDMTIPALK